jgi:hypothetical protein
MQDHTFDSAEAALRPKAARIDEPVTDQLGRAASERRPDVMGASGVLDLQRSAGNGGVTAMLEEERSPVHDVVSSSGRPLEPEVRADMETRLGADFGDVRVHDDDAAHSSAKGVNAHAYTVGSNVVFQRDAYDPASAEGKVMLAHELTHVIQQRNGPVDGTSAPGGISVSHPSDRFEREAAANADRVMAAPSAPTSNSLDTPAIQRHATDSGLPALQREEAPEEEEAVQGVFVQREEQDETEEE